MPKSQSLTHAGRVLRIRELLDGRPFVTVAGLREEFGVSRRTVYNDLAALEAAGVPLYSEPGPSGEARWKIETAAKKQTVTMTVGQILAFAMAREALSFLGGTHLVEDLETVTRKLAGGRLRLTMQVSGIEDVRRWLLGHTGTFKVLAPAGLRRRVRSEAKRAAALNTG